MRTKIPQALYLPAPKLNQLHILTEIASDPGITQATLAQRCKLSVAMVNNYMKELCAGGLIEYRRKSSKSVSYHLTEAGKEAADSIKRQLLQALIKLYGDAKERVREIIHRQAEGNLQRLVLYGSGDLAELAFHALESSGATIVGVCNDDPVMIGREWCGREVLNPSQIRLIAPDAVIIASFGRTNEVHNSLSYLQERGIRLIWLDGVIFNCPLLEDSMPSSVSEDLSLSPGKLAV